MARDFFGLGQFGAALVTLAVLVVVVAAAAVRFYRIDRMAGFLLAPYVIWLCVALALNAAYWKLNA